MILRTEIFGRVVSQLQRIAVANTYTLYGQEKNFLTNVGDKVWQWRSAVFDKSELPALIVRDLDEPVERSSPRSERVERQLHMQVEIVCGDIDTLRLIYADVEAAIGEGRESVWADITSDTRPRLSRTVFEQDSSVVAGGIVEFYIDYPSVAFMSVV